MVETVVGIALFGVTFVSLYGAMAQSLASLHMSREHLRATQIMVEKLEVVRLYNWQRLNDPAYLRRTFKVSYTPLPAGGLPGSSPEGTTYFGSIIISDPPITANYKSNLKVVTVRVTWKTGTIDRARSMSTLVAFDGLHTYVY